MRIIARAAAAIAILAILAGCAPWTPEQRAAYEAQDQQRAQDCQLRGGWYVSGSCVSRGGGA